MTRRVLWCFSVALTVWACEPVRSDRPLSVGDPHPAVGLADAEPGLVWVFEVDGCLTCNLGEAVRHLRSFRHRFGTDSDWQRSRLATSAKVIATWSRVSWLRKECPRLLSF